MIVRVFNRESDYVLAVAWWKARGYPVSQLFMLPPTGYVVESLDAKPIAIGFLMRTDAGICGPVHLVSDPKAPSGARNKALDALIETIMMKAVELGYRVVAAETNLEGLVQRYQKHGFTVTDRNVTGMVKVV